jgi:hypothetical protein
MHGIWPDIRALSTWLYAGSRLCCAAGHIAHMYASGQLWGVLGYGPALIWQLAISKPVDSSWLVTGKAQGSSKGRVHSATTPFLLLRSKTSKTAC